MGSVMRFTEYREVRVCGVWVCGKCARVQWGQPPLHTGSEGACGGRCACVVEVCVQWDCHSFTRTQVSDFVIWRGWGASTSACSPEPENALKLPAESSAHAVKHSCFTELHHSEPLLHRRSGVDADQPRRRRRRPRLPQAVPQEHGRRRLRAASSRRDATTPSV